MVHVPPPVFMQSTQTIHTIVCVPGAQRPRELRPLLLSKLDKIKEAHVKIEVNEVYVESKILTHRVAVSEESQAILTCFSSYYCTSSAPRTAKRQTDPTHGAAEGRLQAAQVPAVCSQAVSVAVALTRYSDSDCRQKDRRGCYS